MQSARPCPPRPTIAYVDELTALDAPLQREILREWLARSETAPPAPTAGLAPSLADDYEDFVITTVRDRPQATPSGLSREAAEAARKLPAWTFAVGALPLAIVALLFVLTHAGRASAPRSPIPHIATVSTVQPKRETPPTKPAEVAVRLMPPATIAVAIKSPSTRAAAASTAARPATTAVPIPVPKPEVDTELVDNSDFGSRK